MCSRASAKKVQELLLPNALSMARKWPGAPPGTHPLTAYTSGRLLRERGGAITVSISCSLAVSAGCSTSLLATNIHQGLAKPRKCSQRFPRFRGNLSHESHEVLIMASPGRPTWWIAQMRLGCGSFSTASSGPAQLFLRLSCPGDGA